MAITNKDWGYSEMIKRYLYDMQLNDCLLYTSYVGSPSPTCGLKLHHELPLNRMEVQLPTGSTLTKESDGEFNVISTTRSFTLSTSSTALRDEWMAALEEAISQFQSRQSTFPTKSTSGTESVASEPRLGQQVRLIPSLLGKAFT